MHPNLKDRLLTMTSRQSIDDARDHAIEIPNFPEVRMTPVGPWIFTRSDIIQSMSTWRAHSRDMYFAQFPESAASMREYLLNNSVETSDAILLLIEDYQERLLGHLGLKNFTTKQAEIDSVMRNPKVRLPGLMKSALEGLIVWSQEEFGLDELSLRVISYNSKALALYREAGFRVVEELSLQRVSRSDFVEHHTVSLSDANVDYTCIVMRRTLNRLA